MVKCNINTLNISYLEKICTSFIDVLLHLQKSMAGVASKTGDAYNVPLGDHFANTEQ